MIKFEDDIFLSDQRLGNRSNWAWGRQKGPGPRICKCADYWSLSPTRMETIAYIWNGISTSPPLQYWRLGQWVTWPSTFSTNIVASRCFRPSLSHYAWSVQSASLEILNLESTEENQPPMLAQWLPALQPPFGLPLPIVWSSGEGMP
jgi:hypothetical protein